LKSPHCLPQPQRMRLFGMPGPGLVCRNELVLQTK
jgi:hypothetical protein